MTPNDKIILCFLFSRIPSGTDGWMEYVPISEKKNISALSPQQFKEGNFTTTRDKAEQELHFEEKALSVQLNLP